MTIDVLVSSSSLSALVSAGISLSNAPIDSCFPNTTVWITGEFTPYLKMWILSHWIWGRAWASAFLICSPVMMMMLVCGSHFGKQKYRTSSKFPYLALKMSLSAWCVPVCGVWVCVHTCVHACVKLAMVMGVLKLSNQMSFERLNWLGRTVHGVDSIWCPSSPY